MDFNPGRTKQAQGVIFSCKAKEIYSSVSQSSSQKHLGVILDTKLTLDEHLKMISLKNKENLKTSQKIAKVATKINTN